MSEHASLLNVQVCYARADRQFLFDVKTPAGTTLEQAIQYSSILDVAPEIDLAQCKTGIHGKLKALDTILREGDRVEIYRGLTADPKEARRRRAKRKME